MKQFLPESTEPATVKYSAESRGVLKRHYPAFTPFALVVWVIAISAGLLWILNSSNIPGKADAAPSVWPSGSRIPLDAAVPTLVVFAHPRCPCTRATLGELELLVAGRANRVRAHVLFIEPDGADGAWTRSDLWRKAAAIPGVIVHSDHAEVEAHLFRATTSGHTALYQPDGRLVFQGGITISRGHAGDNPGRASLADLLDHKSPDRVNTPTFGCPLSRIEIPQNVVAWKR